MKRILALLILVAFAQPAWAIDFVKVGAVDVCHDVAILDADATDGSGKTGIAFGAITCKYKRGNQASPTTMTLVDGTVGTQLDNSWKEVANGVYQICPPDAAYASGRTSTIWCYGASDAAPMWLRVVLTDSTPDVNVQTIEGVDATTQMDAHGGGSGGGDIIQE